VISDERKGFSQTCTTGTGFFITGDGYLISNYHVVKAATKVRLVTSAGTIDAKVVQVDAANDLALLKADGIPRGGTPLPIADCREPLGASGGTVATIGFPDPSLQDFRPSWPEFNAKTQRCQGAKDRRCLPCSSAPLRLCVKNFSTSTGG
jgi:Trypsin-like peptidase domain